MQDNRYRYTDKTRKQEKIVEIGKSKGKRTGKRRI